LFSIFVWDAFLTQIKAFLVADNVGGESSLQITLEGKKQENVGRKKKQEKKKGSEKTNEANTSSPTLQASWPYFLRITFIQSVGGERK